MASSYKYLEEKSVITNGFFSILFFICGLRIFVLSNHINFKYKTTCINSIYNETVK